MKLLKRRRRDRVAETLHESRERLLPADPDRFDAWQVVANNCRPLVCDIEDNYVCDVHSNG